MSTLRLALNNFKSDDAGQDLIEYALIATLIALVVVGAVGSVGQALRSAYLRIAGGV